MLLSGFGVFSVIFKEAGGALGQWEVGGSVCAFECVHVFDSGGVFCAFRSWCCVGLWCFSTSLCVCNFLLICGFCTCFCVYFCAVTGSLWLLHVPVWVLGILWFLCVFLCEFVVSV